MSQVWIGTQIGGTLIGPSPLGGLTNKDKNMFFIFVKKHYKVLTFFRLKKFIIRKRNKTF